MKLFYLFSFVLALVFIQGICKIKIMNDNVNIDFKEIFEINKSEMWHLNKNTIFGYFDEKVKENIYCKTNSYIPIKPIDYYKIIIFDTESEAINNGYKLCQKIL